MVSELECYIRDSPPLPELRSWLKVAEQVDSDKRDALELAGNALTCISCQPFNFIPSPFTFQCARPLSPVPVTTAAAADGESNGRAIYRQQPEGARLWVSGEIFA